MLRVFKKSATHETLFAERYDRLLTWSLRLTDNDRPLAEDLLHDVFILFTLNQPDLSQVQNVDAYLHTMLRNLHLSQMRSPTRSRFQQLSILDYDSAEIGLWAIEPRDQIHAQDELRRVCHYACVRKETAKFASVLILRFFHGYYPSEIVQILRTSRKAIDRGLALARVEAKAATNDPQSLNFIRRNQIPPVIASGFSRGTEAFLKELRETVFGSHQGNCLSNQLKAIYQAEGQAALSCTELAHVVSCAHCLDEVNRLLELPRLSERYPTDTMNKDGGSHGSGGPPSGGSPVNVLSRWKRQARDVFEHKPKELCIAVNGYIQGSQTISSELMEQSLNIDTPEKISFVEVFSEQGIRLLFLNVDQPPPDGPGEQMIRVTFSDRRTLELSLVFKNPWPTIHVAYRDPMLDDGLSSATFEEADSEATTDLFAVPTAAVVPSHSPRRTRFDFSRLSGWSFWTRPATVTAMVLLLGAVVALVLYLTKQDSPALTAKGLLARSAAAENAVAADKSIVIHRVVNLEERRSQGGELVNRRKLDIWQSAGKGLTTVRLYDDKENLLAGDWRRADGVRTLYQHGAPPQVRLINPRSALRSFDDVWQLSSSAADLVNMVGDAGSTQVETHSDRYLINLVFNSKPESPIVKVMLTLNGDLHLLEEVFVIKLGTETHEFRFVETAFERWSPSAVSSTAFEPDPVLNSISKSIPAPREPQPESTATLGIPAIASPALEVEVLRLLNQAGADMGEQVSVQRMPQGFLQVDALVETEKRKAELIQALSPVANNPAVRLRIKTVTEATNETSARKSNSPKVAVEQLESINDSALLQPDLRQWFVRQGLTEAQAEAKATQLADQMVSQSGSALQHAWALKRLAERWSPNELRSLDTEARLKWLAMIGSHARAIQRQAAALRQGLQPIFGASPSGTEPSFQIGSDSDLVLQMERLFVLCLSNDEVVRAALTVSPEAAKGAAVKSQRFWQSLREAELLANRIEFAARS
jgi:DNA-directed RNA polymerase specialized sigma24 family protein